MTAQETTFTPSLKSSDQYKYDKYHVMYYLHQGDELMVIHRSKKSLLLEKFNSKTMESLGTVEVENFSKAYCVFERLLTLNQRHFLVYSSYDKKNKKDRLLCREIDFSAGNFKTKEQVILEADGEIPADYETTTDIKQKHGFTPKYNTDYSYNLNRYRFEFSKDSSSIFVAHAVKRGKSKNKETIGIYLLNNTLKKVWGNLVEMPYPKKEMKLLDYGVDSKQNGYVYLQKSNQQLELLQYKNGVLQKTIALNGLTEHIYQSTILEREDGSLVFAGYTTNEKENGELSNIYFFNLNIQQETAISDLKTKSIPLSLATKCNPKFPTNAFRSLKLDIAFLQEDGSLFLIGEAHYSSVDETTNILISKLDIEGTSEWITAIPKRQGLYQGYYYTKTNHQHTILFVDDIVNHKKEENPSIFQYEKGRYMAICYISDDNGQINKDICIPPDSEYCPAANNIHFISDQEFVFWGWRFPAQGLVTNYNTAKIGYQPFIIPNSGKPKSIVKGTFSK